MLGGKISNLELMMMRSLTVTGCTVPLSEEEAMNNHCAIMAYFSGFSVPGYLRIQYQQLDKLSAPSVIIHFESSLYRG